MSLPPSVIRVCQEEGKGEDPDHKHQGGHQQRNRLQTHPCTVCGVCWERITRAEDSPDAGRATSCETSETLPRVLQGKNEEISSVLFTDVHLDIYLLEFRKLI